MALSGGQLFAADTGSNSAPVATDDNGSLSAVIVDVVANDSDADGDPLTLTGVSGAANGTATIENNQLRYDPDAKLFNDGVMMKDLKTSVSRAAVGFSLGASLGILASILTARVALVRLAVYPFFNILRPIPAIALVPIAIVWFGIGEESKYFVIAYTVFLAVWLATHHGMEHVSETYIRASRSLGAVVARIL